ATWQRVQHLVRQDHALDRAVRQTVEPDHSLSQLARKSSQPLFLPLREVGADLQDGVPLRHLAGDGETLENDGRHPSRARAELQNLPFAAEHLGTLPGHAAAEEIGDLRRRDEVPARAELYAARAVVAEPRGIERKLHELLERDPAPRGADP